MTLGKAPPPHTEASATHRPAIHTKVELAPVKSRLHATRDGSHPKGWLAPRRACRSTTPPTHRNHRPPSQRPPAADHQAAADPGGFEARPAEALQEGRRHPASRRLGMSTAQTGGRAPPTKAPVPGRPATARLGPPREALEEGGLARAVSAEQREARGRADVQVKGPHHHIARVIPASP